MPHKKPGILSVVVPMRIAKKASTRNRIRRQVSEAIRKLINRNSFPFGVRTVITVKSAELPDLEEIRRILVPLLKKSGILIQ